MIKHSGTARKRRQIRTRVNIRGTGSRPRLSVYRSNRYISAQLIDDTSGKTMLTVHSKVVEGASKSEKALAVGKMVAQKAKEQSIDTVVFDRGAYRYHGQVRKIAEGAREGGLKF